MKKIENEILSDNNINNIISVAIYCAVPIVLLIVLMLIANTIYTATGINNIAAETLVVQTIPSLLALGVIPGLIFKITTKKALLEIVYPGPYLKLTRKISVFLFILFAIVLVYFKSYTLMIIPFIFHFFIIAVVEEFLIRGIITNRLEAIFPQEWLAIIFSAFIFSFIFHSESSFGIGLLSHTPFALMMSIIYRKTGSLEIPILVHWSYDVILTMIEVM